MGNVGERVVSAMADRSAMLPAKTAIGEGTVHKLVVIKYLRLHLFKLAKAMGDDWEPFRARFENLLSELPGLDDWQLTERVDQLIDLGLSSGAAEQIRNILKAAVHDTGVRGHPAVANAKITPTPLESLSREFCDATLGVLRHFTRRLPARAAPEIRRSHDGHRSGIVECAVYGPQVFEVGGMALLQVFIYDVEQQERAARRAIESDLEAKWRAGRRLPFDPPIGARLLVRMDIPGLLIDEPEQVIVWTGDLEQLQFAVDAGLASGIGSRVGRVTLAVDGIPIGVLRFRIDIAAKAGEVDSSDAGTAATRFRRAFISYSSEDRAEVLKRVQMLKASGIDVFQDVLALEPGQRWERKLYEEIDRCDVFFVFWSASAKASEWVVREMRYAWEKKQGVDANPPEFVPIPIQGPPIASPPDFVSHIHFNDALLAPISAHER